eukprot:TRINITY_DN5078_c0_g1_i1.p1 TRINITY_DN5078_c0_g1~~TRINITY_DN5078_c0_g1_i1.p1  ORF type:complete len:204 (-),score=57.57 TRINITY_DN5078_c0_g1_i1:58-669(-)
MSDGVVANDEIDFKSLLLLLKAPNKKSVDEIFVAVHQYRNDAAVLPPELLTKIAEALGASPEDTEAMALSIRNLIKKALYDLLVQEQLAEIFPQGFHGAMAQLINTIVTHRLPAWRREAITSHIFLSRLISINWRIDIKSASNHISQMAVPTVLVELKVQQPPTNTSQDEASLVKTILFELDSVTLQTMLDGLGKIKDQLAAI